jgi:protocatechuate 3,4-dioxygenase beta subunit
MTRGALILLLALGNDLGFLLAHANPGDVATPSAKRNPRSLQGATITGQVVDARTRQPLRGAIVSAPNVRAGKPDARPAIGFRTGQDGRFVLRGVAPGIVNFVVSKAGYAPGPYASVRPAADGETIDNVVLTVPTGASLGGRVMDEAGQPVAGAIVTVRSAAPLALAGRLMPAGSMGTTGEDGRYWIGGLSAGEYVATIGSAADQANIVRFGNQLFVKPIAPGRPTAESTQKVTLASGEERTDADLVVQFRTRFTGVRPADYGSTTIDGRVVDGRGAPFPHATILLRQTNNRATTVTTQADGSGRFQFQNIPAGSFSIATVRSGATYTVESPDPTPLEIAAEPRTVNVILTAERGGAISGTLTDEFGDPATAAVFALAPARVSRSGESVPNISSPDGAVANTDARGRFRIANVPPGEYVINVISSDPITARTEVHVEDPPGRERLLTPSSLFYPGVTTVSQASKIVVADGSETSGVDMMIQPPLVASINVSVTANRPVNEIQLHQILLDDQLPMLEHTTTFTGTSTATLTAKVGRYRLLASAEVASSTDSVVRLWSAMDVDTDPAFPATVNMVLEPGANIAGRIVFEGAETNRRSAGAWLLPMAQMPGIRIPTMDGNRMLTTASGEFSIEGVIPGRYAIHAGGSSSDTPWILKAATVGSQDLLDVPIDLRPGDEIANVRLTVTDRISELTGTVTDAAGKPALDDWIVVFSAEKKHWWSRSRRVRLIRPDPKGQYRLRALPAGNYIVAPVPDAIGLSQEELLSRLPALAAAGVRLTLAEGERKVQDLRVK